MRRAARMPVENLAPYLLEMPRPGTLSAVDANPAESVVPPLGWSGVFGNQNPIEVEVGFGKGLFLVTSGVERPDTNFFGIEIERKYALYTATRLAKRQLSNVKLAIGDARDFLQSRLPPGSVAAVHVYFPDPWWKNRHRKRRLFTELFAHACARVLVVGGLLHFVSDVEAYFAESAAMLAKCESFVRQPEPAAKEPAHDMDFLTNFERKYRRGGRPIYRGLWQKT